MLSRRRSLVVGAATLAHLVSLSADARADGTVRRRFDPEDLSLETPGSVHADVQFGVVRGETAGRWLVPDFDLDVGLAPNVELGLDGAFALEGTGSRLYALDHPAPDNLWLSSKIGLLDQAHAGSGGAWAAGLQLGPRVPVAPGAHGIGLQALVLVGRSFGASHLVANAGVLVEPGAAVSHDRPSAILLGIDGQIPLGGAWSLAADVSQVLFTSPDRHQLTSTVGLVLAAAPWLDVSLNGLVGFLAGGDRYGAFLGLSPRIPVF